MKNYKKVISIFLASAIIASQITAIAAETTVDAFGEKYEIMATDNEKITESAFEDFSESSFDWQVISGKGFKKSSGRLVFNNKQIKGTENVIICNDINVKNDEVEFDMNAEDADYTGFIFRMNDNKNFYKIRFYYRTNSVYFLKKVKGGEYVSVAKKSVPLEFNKNYKVGLSLLGDELILKLDGTEILKVKDSALKEGSVGFEASNAKAYFDNLCVFKYNDIKYDFEDTEDEAKDKIVIYAAAKGDSSVSDGTEQHPYIGMDAAKDAVKRLKRSNVPIDVVFLGGEYFVNSTITFNRVDSGTAKAPIRYMAKEGENVVFTGAKKLDASKFYPISEEIKNRLSDNVKDKVVAINLAEQGVPESIIDFTSIADQGAVGYNMKTPIITLNGNKQNVARWPNTGYNNILSCVSGDTGANGKNGGTIYYSESRPKRWTQADDMFIEGWLGFYWHGEWAKVKDIDVENNAINMKYATAYGIKQNHRWAAINLLEEIDIPGEWYIDKKTKMMYYYPPHTLSSEDDFQIATLETNLVSFDGAKYITLEGIEFTMSADTSAYTGRRSDGGNGINIQKASSNITIKDCVLSHIGMDGILINTTDVTIDGCVIYDVGFNGIYCEYCGERNTLKPSNVVIKNCDISNVCRDTGQNAWGGIVVYSASVDVNIRNNLLHDIGNSAIRYGGNGHQMTNNEIYDVVTTASDAGAIYAGRSFAEYGNVVKYNFFHNIGMIGEKASFVASSLFLDDMESGTEFSNNISVVNNYSQTAGIEIGGGIDVVVNGNTFVASEKDIMAEDRSTSRVTDWENYINTTLKLNTVDYKNPTYMAKYPQTAGILDRILANNNVLKLENTITNNLTVDCTTTQIADTVKKDSIIENNVNVGNDYSVFVDPDNLDYRVTAEAKKKYSIPDDVLDETFDIDSIGIVSDYNLDTDRMKFESLYPENNAVGIETKDAQLAWSDSSYADAFRYVVSDDADFNNIIFDNRTKNLGTSLTGLENGKTYYWKVYALNESRKYGCSVESSSGVFSFTTAAHDTLDMSVLREKIDKAQDMLNTIVEGNKAGQYKSGTRTVIRTKISEAEQAAAMDIADQSYIDTVAYELNNFINNIEAYSNVGYTTINTSNNSSWVTNNTDSKVSVSEGVVTLKPAAGTEFSLDEVLSNYNIMCFKTRIENLEDTWVAYGLRALDKNTALYNQDAYYILVKPDIFELQKHGKIYMTAPNNGKMKQGEWYDVEFGSITTENGVNMVFKLNGETIFDYLDKNEVQYKPGMFAVFASDSAKTVEIKAATNVPQGLYTMSDEILQQIKDKGIVCNTETEGYSEFGVWNVSETKTGDLKTAVRTNSTKDDWAEWVLNVGEKGNDKMYKVSYYHIPQPDGDKNAKIHVSGRNGDYETTIDLSQGEEGYVEIGTFVFASEDYIGRLNVRFIGSGEGVLNISNIRYEEVDSSQYSDMLE